MTRIWALTVESGEKTTWIDTAGSLRSGGRQAGRSSQNAYRGNESADPFGILQNVHGSESGWERNDSCPLVERLRVRL